MSSCVNCRDVLRNILHDATKQIETQMRTEDIVRLIDKRMTKEFNERTWRRNVWD